MTHSLEVLESSRSIFVSKEVSCLKFCFELGNFVHQMSSPEQVKNLFGNLNLMVISVSLCLTRKHGAICQESLTVYQISRGRPFAQSIN